MLYYPYMGKAITLFSLSFLFSLSYFLIKGIWDDGQVGLRMQMQTGGLEKRVWRQAWQGVIYVPNKPQGHTWLLSPHIPLFPLSFPLIKQPCFVLFSPLYFLYHSSHSVFLLIGILCLECSLFKILWSWLVPIIQFYTLISPSKRILSDPLIQNSTFMSIYSPSHLLPSIMFSVVLKILLFYF